MKLEVGKKYVTRKGDVVEIVSKGGRIYQFEGDNYSTYTGGGSVFFTGESDQDLIGEYQEPKSSFAKMIFWAVALDADEMEEIIDALKASSALREKFKEAYGK